MRRAPRRDAFDCSCSLPASKTGQRRSFRLSPCPPGSILSTARKEGKAPARKEAGSHQPCVAAMDQEEREAARPLLSDALTNVRFSQLARFLRLSNESLRPRVEARLVK